MTEIKKCKIQVLIKIGCYLSNLKFSDLNSDVFSRRFGGYIWFIEHVVWLYIVSTRKNLASLEIQVIMWTLSVVWNLLLGYYIASTLYYIIKSNILPETLWDWYQTSVSSFERSSRWRNYRVPILTSIQFNYFKYNTFIL